MPDDAGNETLPLSEQDRPQIEIDHARHYPHVRRAAAAMAWALMPRMYGDLIAYLSGERGLLSAVYANPQQHFDFVNAARSGGSMKAGAIAVLPFYGVVAKRMDLMSATSGGVSTEQFTKSFRQAMADASVSGIVINIDSPGGAVYGVAELADEIYQARKTKPVAAIANDLAASAAYWIGAAAGAFSCTPTGQVGSIGVFTEHFDESRMMDAMGVTPTLISAGKYKTEGSPYQPLGGEALAALQDTVNEYYGMFVKGVARGRGVSQAAVRDGFGEGRVVTASKAIDMGMIDRVETLDQMLARLGGGKVQTSANARAEGPFKNEIEIARARLRLRSAEARGGAK